MKYQVGDTVLLLHSNEEGRVLDIINKDMLMVEVNGVSFPVYMDQVDFPYFKRFSENKIVPAKKQKTYIDDVRKEKSKEPRVEDGVWLTFLPVMDLDEFGDVVVEDLKLHLVNHTSVPYKFHYQLFYFGKQDFELKNTIQPFEDFYLHDIDFATLNDSPVFGFEFMLLQPDKKKEAHYEASVKLKPKQFFNRIEELKAKNQATFSQLLFNEYPDKKHEIKMDMGKLAARGYKIYDASQAKHHLESARSVIDLHIDKLTDGWNHLKNHEILTLQLKTFEKYYHLAILHHQPSLVVIHGIGEGRLKNEIHEILRLKKEVKSFVNQYHPNFGYGATEIFFQY